jgi:putative intracellular protease/amidase
MPDQVLAGKTIGVLVESQYIAHEIRTYQDRFAAYGARVELMSRLWGNPSITFVSEVENVGGTPETLEVRTDFSGVDPADYAAIIMAANYPSVRLRWFEPPAGQAITPEMMRTAPAVRFFRQVMQNPSIIKGAPCHGLWLLTPNPDIAAGRRVTCNPVVLADVVNTGAIFVPPPVGQDWARHIVVDGDLVTSTSAHNVEVVELFVDAIKDRILAGEQGTGARSRAPAGTQAETSASAVVRPAPAKRRILTLLSEWGYWGEELVGPLDEFDRAGYRTDFCTPNGRRPNAIPVSADPDYFDPPLQRPVTTLSMAARVREIDDPTTEQGRRLDNPINLAAWFPERPYFAAPNFVRGLEAYNRALDRAVADLAVYDAVLIVGGSGPVVDLANNQRVHDVILGFLRLGKPVAAECYGVTCLAFARDMNERESIIRGKHVTGHCLEYDYKDGTAFVRARGEFLDFNMGPPPYPLEFILRDATAPGGGYHGNFGEPTSVIVDYPFITGRSTPDSILTGQKLIEVLDGDPPLRRWGW